MAIQVLVLTLSYINKYKVTLTSTFDAPLQVAAYVGALNHDDRYAGQVESALIVIVYNDGRQATVLPLTKFKLETYWKDWLTRLHLYQKMKAFEAEHNKQ